MYRSWVSRKCIQGFGVRSYQSCSETGVYGYRQKVKTEYQGICKNEEFIFILKNRHDKCAFDKKRDVCRAVTLLYTIRWNCCSRLKSTYLYRYFWLQDRNTSEAYLYYNRIFCVMRRSWKLVPIPSHTHNKRFRHFLVLSLWTYTYYNIHYMILLELNVVF